jgi:hypothetical protein
MGSRKIGCGLAISQENARPTDELSDRIRTRIDVYANEMGQLAQKDVKFAGVRSLVQSTAAWRHRRLA